MSKRVSELRFSCEQLLDVIQDIWTHIPDDLKKETDIRVKSAEEIIQREQLQQEVK